MWYSAVSCIQHLTGRAKIELFSSFALAMSQNLHNKEKLSNSDSRAVADTSHKITEERTFVTFVAMTAP